MDDEVDGKDIIENLSPNPELDQWKFYAQTTLNTSNRRLKNNRFYIRVLLGLLAAVGAGSKLGFVNPVGILVAGLVGFPMCILWYFNIVSYKQLNSGKYEVLTDMAEKLPFSPYDKEWQVLKQGDDMEAYIPHTTVEMWWPRIIGMPFSFMVLYGALEVSSLTKYWSRAAIVAGFLWISYFASVILGKPLFKSLYRKFKG